MIEIATCSYTAYRPTQGRGFMTTVGKPRGNHPLSHLPAMNTVAPYGVFNVKPALSQPDFIEKYLARLDRKRDDVLADLQNAWNAYEERVVLLCWCRVTSPDHTTPEGFCHRLVAGWWIGQQLGISVPELALAAPRPETPQDPSLF